MRNVYRGQQADVHAEEVVARSDEVRTEMVAPNGQEGAQAGGQQAEDQETRKGLLASERGGGGHQNVLYSVRIPKIGYGGRRALLETV